MPLYEYVCGKCSLKFEQLVMGGNRPACPSCGSHSLEKQLSVFAVGAGGSTSSSGPAGMPGGCGSCGDPRGPGACALDDE